MASACSSRDPKELHALKLKAMKYYQNNGVPQKMEEIMNSMFYEDPPDVYGHLVNYFSQFTKPAQLKKITAQEGFDSIGQPAILSQVFCTVNNKEKLISSSTIPNGELKVKTEEKEKATLDMHQSVKKAIGIINEELTEVIADHDPVNQSEIDAIILSIIEKKKEEELAKKNSDEENQEEIPPPAPPADDKDKKKSAKPRSIDEELKPGKGSVAVEVLPDRPPELFTPGKEIVAAVSQSVCVCAASAHNIECYRHVANIARTKGAVNEFRIPLPMVTIVQSGKHALGKVNCIKDYMVVPGTELPIAQSLVHIQNIYNHVAKSFAAKMGVASKYVNDSGALCPAVDVPTQVLDLLQEAVNAEGLTIGEDMYLAINAAAHECFDYEKGKYEILSGTFKSPDEIVEFWADLKTKYPSICAIIDPLRGRDTEAWGKLCERVSEGTFIVGDHFYDRPGVLLKEEMPAAIQTSGIVFRLENMTSVSDIINCANKFNDAKNEIVIDTCHGDTTDTFIVDLAVGLNARFFKVGGPCRGEKSCKLNRLIGILSELEPPEAEDETEENTEEKEDKSLFIEETSQQEVEEDSFRLETGDEAQEQEQEPPCEQRFGENEKSRLKLHTPFLFPFLQNPPPTATEAEDEADKEEKMSISPKRSK